jgi:tRNA(fMet)-specific endonuclease VapC
MPGKYLLDTNIVIALRQGEGAVVDRIASVECFISSVIAGELYYGAFKSPQPSENRVRTDALLDAITMLVIDRETARHYGMVKADLRIRQNPIPEGDIWIAATALQYNLTLATRDKHFEHVTDLKREEW